MRAWAEEAKQVAGSRRAAWQTRTRTSWNDWVAQELRSGASALHRFTKRDEAPLQASVTSPQGTQSLALQDLVDHDFEMWAKIWGKYDEVAGAPWRQQKILEKDLLPSVTPNDIRRCANAFARCTGRGCENIHPRWFGWLSDGLLSEIADLLTDLERLGFWPKPIQHIIVALIPKADGGRRPIGLLPALVRLWEKLRRPVVARWRTATTRSYNWAAKGRSPQAAVWKESLRSEAAAAKGLSSGAVLIDLVKAFEMVRLELIWYAGVRLGFPVAILRLILESFAFDRRLKCGGAYSEAFETKSAILAGGGYATDALFMILVDPCDMLIQTFPSADICLFVDDLTIHVRGSESEVASDLPAATEWCIQRLEDDLHLMVSRARTALHD